MEVDRDLTAKASGILCLNAGSSSLKFAVYEHKAAAAGGDESRLVAGAVERIGLKEGRFRLNNGDTAATETAGEYPDHATAVHAVFDALERRGLSALDAVGHRLVHGGAEHTAPERVNAQLLEALRGLVPLAPLHLPSELSVMEAVTARFPALPQVACFDTAFHHRMPELARRLPLPRTLWDAGI